MQTTDSSSPHALTQTCAPAQSRRGLTRSAALVAISALVASLGSAYASAPYVRSDKPITDENGRTKVIVDFLDDAHVNYPGEIVASPKARAEGESIPFRQHPQVVSLVLAYERAYDFEATGMTSWVANSLTAFLTQEQIAALREDRQVKQMWDVTEGKFSLPPPWTDTVSSESISWGWKSINGKPLEPGSTRRVYVIDSGVAQHSQLNVITRVNTACNVLHAAAAGSGTCDIFNDPTYTYSPVGCYGHATHVAGIIGAYAGDSLGTAGVYSGVQLISVAITRAVYPNATGYGSPASPGSTTPNWCSANGPHSDALGYALDYVYYDTLNNAGGKVTIANLSANPMAVGWTSSGLPEANYSKLKALTKPALTKDHRQYQGAFFAQSASNEAANGCNYVGGASYAYRPNPSVFPNTTDPSDGIMVVGAIHDTGLPVQTGNGFGSVTYPSGTNPSGLTLPPNPSNYGPCLDVWAPGNLIVSSWGNHAYPHSVLLVPPVTPYSGNVSIGSSGWGYISGTSMAAPHIAGAAAYVADKFALTSPAAIEQKLRSYFASYGTDLTSPTPQAVNIVQLP